jgi:hypothetical protein
MSITINKLVERLRIDRRKAKHCFLAIRRPHQALTGCKQAAKWVNSCYNMPSNSEISMACLNDILEGCGVEAVMDESGMHAHCEYVNMGDTYTPTICLVDGCFVVASWGDLVERHNW